jgi:proline racemase
MSGAILQPPLLPEADWGVVFIEVSGCLPMCGHGTIGVATVLVETGMVEVREPETLVRLDVPAGLVEARVAVSEGRARSVTIRNVPSFLHARDRVVAADGMGEVRYDMAFGGNFYAIVDAASAGVVVDPARADELVERLVVDALARGGTCTGEHGIGRGKLRALELEHGDLLPLMRGIKRLFDPNGILNPGKVFES